MASLARNLGGRRLDEDDEWVDNEGLGWNRQSVEPNVVYAAGHKLEAPARPEPRPSPEQPADVATVSSPLKAPARPEANKDTGADAATQKLS